MTDQTEKIEQRIDNTKESLAGKLDALETRVSDAVLTTTETVSETVGAVKETFETVKEKVQDAGEFFNLKRQAERNPWAVFGCSVAAGCLASYLLSNGAKSRREGKVDERPPESVRRTPAVSRAEKPVEESEAKHGWLREQMGSLSGLAVGALMGAVRDLAARNLPEGLGQSISKEVDRFTTELGSKPVAGPVIPPPKQPAV